RRTERAAYRTKFYSNLSSPTRFDEEPIKQRPKISLIASSAYMAAICCFGLLFYLRHRLFLLFGPRCFDL
ncbi:hypothetical protein DVW06_12420, partial [Enterococcus sp. ARL09-542]